MTSSGRSTKPTEATPSFFESLYVSLTADAAKIGDGLYLGAAVAGKEKAAMQKKKITHILICHPTLKEYHPEHFKYHRAKLADTPDQNMLEHLPNALQFLGDGRRRGGSMFVCCMKGISRSSSIVISFLMVEQGIGFDAAWKACEERRPVVYPNVGFQQQLRYLEKVLSELEPNVSFDNKLRHLHKKLPRGSLEGPTGPLRIRDAIGGSLNDELDNVEATSEKVMAQPQLLQQRELWKRHGLFFENFHKYKTLPSDAALLGRAEAVVARLRSLPKIFNDSIKGVKLALSVAKEIEDWLRFAKPVLQRMPAPAVPAVDGKANVDHDMEDPMAKFDREKSDSSTTTSHAQKLSKKEKKQLKKQKKEDKKAQKAAKKAEKLAKKIEKVARVAEERARVAVGGADLIAKRAAAMEAELDEEEAREAAALEQSRKWKRERCQLAGISDSEDSGRKQKKRKSSPPRREVAIDAYADLDGMVRAGSQQQSRGGLFMEPGNIEEGKRFAKAVPS
jgi:protein-tyrosine phosphatase